MSKEIISIGSETRPPVLVVGEYQQWKRRMINFLDLLDDKLMVSIIEGPIRPTVTVAEVARTDVTPHLPAYEVEKPYDMFSHEQRPRAAIDKRALTLLTMALPNDMFARVDSCKDARAMWLGIEQQMQGGDKALEGQKENAMNAYESFCARKGETLTETYNRLNICVNDLRRLGLEKNKYEVNVKFLKRLNKLWQSVTISIQVSQNLGQLGLHDLYSMMLPHEETLFGKTEKKLDPPTLALMSNRGSSSHENYTVEEPVVLDDGLTEEEMFQLENSFALMAKFQGNPQRFNRFRQGPQFVGGQSNQGGYQSSESFQRNDQGRTNNYQQRDSLGTTIKDLTKIEDKATTTTSNSKGIRITTPTTTTETEDIREVVTIKALEAPPAANQNRNPARVPTCYNCGDPGHYASDCKKRLKDSAYFEKKAAMMKKKELGKVLLADEEDWIMEPENSDDEGPSAVQGHCLMADFEEPCISGSPNDSTDEEAEVNSCSLLSKHVELSKSETLRLESQLQMERGLVARFRIESVVYKSSLEDLTENFNRMELESGVRESILENKLLNLQRSHDEIESSREELKLKFHILSEVAFGRKGRSVTGGTATEGAVGDSEVQRQWRFWRVTPVAVLESNDSAAVEFLKSGGGNVQVQRRRRSSAEATAKFKCSSSGEVHMQQQRRSSSAAVAAVTFRRGGRRRSSEVVVGGKVQRWWSAAKFRRDANQTQESWELDSNSFRFPWNPANQTHLEERTKLFIKIEELEENNLKRGQSEHTLSLLTKQTTQHPFYQAKPGLGHSEKNILEKAPAHLYNFDNMSASKPEPRSVKGQDNDNYVMQTVTFTEIVDGKAVSFTTSPANSSTSSPLSSPIATSPIFTPARNPENTFTSWEGIKARTPKVAMPPINFDDLNFSYDSREIDTSEDADVIQPLDVSTTASCPSVYRERNVPSQLKRRVSFLEESDSWDSSTKGSPLIPDLRTTVPKLVLDPNIEYDVKVFLDADDPPSGFIPRKPVLPKAPAVKQISSTKPLASVSVINTEGKTCDGTDKGKSVKPHTPTITQTQHSNTKDASSLVKPIKGLDFHSSSFDVDARTGDGTANVKPRRRRYRKKKNSFIAFPKWGGHDHTGLGYNPPSCNSNVNSKSVNSNRSANSYNLTAFKNHICSLFDNYMRVDMPGNANAYRKSGSPYRERNKKMTKQNALPPVKSPKPKEKSEKDTSPAALSVSNGQSMWYFDSGAFRPVTGQRNILFDYVVRAEGFVNLVDKRRLPILGYGSMTNGEHVIKNVRYVEGLPFNLLSSSQFCDGGYLVKTFILGSNIEDEDGNVILRARRNSHLYTTMFYAIPQQMETVVFLAKATKEESWLLHQHLSHQNFRDMNKLVSKHLINGLPETRLSKDTLCSACEKGKMKKSSHPPKMETNYHHPLDMLHMDLCGPMRVESLARKKYMLVLVDEYSRYTWLEFLRAKSDAAELIIAFIKRIQVLLGRQVKKLRSDNGTEFRNLKL
ncbi:hypothetical protein OSB04_011697 [Centaurea solstitialis]|uniref:Uncharacterized protein n=1 Tax=Centaurea solstitialis TaxID=347529 RepID=A0AA38T9X9_9ASTR|nr:hypothetical protein OSB04_011697 [Centaurea solstitialis]